MNAYFKICHFGIKRRKYVFFPLSFWASTSHDNFIDNKPLISEEWDNYLVLETSGNRYYRLNNKWKYSNF